ncbi:MAG: hypothetical protein IMZ53_11850, partial [Thermoplasmata archaeon]|nr:hypothetical protein [Thermoplasmata archaeon]
MKTKIESPGFSREAIRLMRDLYRRLDKQHSGWDCKGKKRHWTISRANDVHEEVVNVVRDTNVVRESIFILHQRADIEPTAISNVYIDSLGEGTFKRVFKISVKLRGKNELLQFVLKIEKHAPAFLILLFLPIDENSLIREFLNQIVSYGPRVNKNSVTLVGNVYRSKDFMFSTEEYMSGYSLDNIQLLVRQCNRALNISPSACLKLLAKGVCSMLFNIFKNSLSLMNIRDYNPSNIMISVCKKRGVNQVSANIIDGGAFKIDESQYEKVCSITVGLFKA